MADTKISQLPPATAVNNGYVFVINQSNVTKRIAVSTDASLGSPPSTGSVYWAENLGSSSEFQVIKLLHFTGFVLQLLPEMDTCQFTLNLWLL
jgi:hypothetical protein